MTVFRYKWVWLAVCILFALLIPACFPTVIELKCDTVPIKAGLDSILNIKTRILIDGTPSMEGFVRAGSANNRYVQILQSLSTSASSSREYYRFGVTREGNNRIDGISPQEFGKAELPEFYNGTKLVYLENSQVSLAIDPPNQKTPNPDELVVVVTDLSEKDQAIDTIIDKLDSIYLKRGFAVGILAVKSQFKGTIFDIGPDNKKFNFDTNQKRVSQYHPFYVLVLGNYGNVANFYETLKTLQNKLLMQETQFTIFYPVLVRSTSSFNLEKYPLKFSDDQKDIEALTIHDGNVLVNIEDSNRIPSFRIEDNNQYKFNHKVDYEKVPYTLNAKLVVEVLSRFLEKKETNSPPNSFKFDSGGMGIHNLEIESGKLSFDSTINGNKLITGIYEFNIDTYVQGTLDQDWWTVWNDARGLDGSKTYNLLRFMKGLAVRVNKIVETQKILAGKFCYAIWKR